MRTRFEPLRILGRRKIRRRMAGQTVADFSRWDDVRVDWDGQTIYGTVVGIGEADLEVREIGSDRTLRVPPTKVRTL